MVPKMAFFTGFGPRRAAGLAEQPKFFFAIVIWHLNEHSVRVSALNSKIFLISTPFHVVQKCNLRKFSSRELKLAGNVPWDGRR